MFETHSDHSWLRFLTFLFLIPTNSLAQEIIPDAVACESCSVVWTEEVQLGNTDGPGYLAGRPWAVSQDNTGRFWVTSPDWLPTVYLPSGDFIERVGTIGDGPGEFRQPAFSLPIPGDSTAVFDPGLQRVSVLNQALEPVRTVRLVGQHLAGVVLGWPRVLTVGIVNTPGDLGLPYHLVDLASTPAPISRSFGGTPGPVAAEDLQALRHRITPAVRGDWIWAAPYSEYKLRKLSLKGEVIGEWIRRPSWFLNPEEHRFLEKGRPPACAVDGLWEDAEGRLWVFLRVPGPDWEGALDDFSDPLVPSAGVPDWDRLFQTKVEVLSPEPWRVHAVGTLDGLVTSVLRNGAVAVYRESPEGIPYMSILRPRLVPSQPEELHPLRGRR